MAPKGTKTTLTENQRPGYHPDGTPKSNDEMSDDEREDFYMNLDSVDEEKSSTKMKKSELKAKIKEDIMSLLQEEEIEEGDSSLEDELMSQLDEAKEDEEEDEEEDVEVEIEDEEGEDIGGGDADTIDPEAGLSQDEQDIQNALKVAFDNATAIGDDKLADQIGNTITMFTRTHVVNR
jgi:(p)ppGpp synthase/HD superfamily hydrolase